MRRTLLVCTLLVLANRSRATDAVVALHGLDPILLAEGKDVPGDPTLTVSEGPFTYAFANAENRARFLANPKQFAAQFEGHCALMRTGLGSPDLYAVHDGKIYVFGDAGCKKTFEAEPMRYSKENGRRNVAIVIYQGVELLDFSGPGEVFAAADRGRAFNVYTVAQHADPVHSLATVNIIPAFTIQNAPRPDILVIPGGNADNAMNDEMIAWVQNVAKDAEIVMSVCNGAFVLAKAGLLDGREATTHHGSIAGLKEFAPKTIVHSDRRYVDNGKVITAAGVSAGIDGSLHVVTRLLGETVAAETARYMEYTTNPEVTASVPAPN